MSPIIMLVVLILMFTGYGAWSCHDKVKKLKCLYEAQDDTVEIKWVKREANEVVFGKDKRFRIVTKYIKSYIERSGVHMFFPTKVSFIRYHWASIYPTEAEQEVAASVVAISEAVTANESIIKDLRDRFNAVKRILVPDLEKYAEVEDGIETESEETGSADNSGE